jgi:Na+-driven multidrug efflux pump
VAATAVAARLSDADVAAHQVAFSVWSLLALALDALAIAGQALTGRSLGAGDVAATREATARMVRWGIGAGIVLGAGVLAVRFVLPGAFTSDPAVRSALTGALLVVAVCQPVAGVVFVLDGVLIGAGDARYLAFAAWISTAIFLAAAGVVLATRAGLVALWGAVGIWMVARLGTLVWRVRTSAWLVVGASG